jgi:hypothetical protein
MPSRLSVALCLIVTSTVACGTRLAGQTDDSGVRADALVPGADSSTPPNKTGGCIVAVRADQCCNEAFPAEQKQVDADPCLIPYENYLARHIPQDCVKKQPKECQYIDCIGKHTVSRIAKRVLDGSCVFASECDTNADCAWGINWRNCCDCGNVYPRAILDADPCLVDVKKPLTGVCKDQCLDNVLCEPCLVAPEVKCVTGRANDKTGNIKVCSPRHS